MSKQPGWPLSLIFFLKLKKTRAKGWIIDVKHIPSKKNQTTKKMKSRSRLPGLRLRRRPISDGLSCAPPWLLFCFARIVSLPSSVRQIFFPIFFSCFILACLCNLDCCDKITIVCVWVCVCVCVREREREREPIDRSLKPEGFAGWLGRPATYSMSGAIHRGRYRCHISASTISLGPPRRPPSMPAVFLKPALDLEAHHRQHGPIFFFFSNVKHRFQIEFSPNFVSSSESSVFSWTHLL